MSSILMNTLFYKAVILQGEIWRRSLFGLRGLKRAAGNLRQAWVGVDSASGEWWEGKREKKEIQIKCTIQVACACVASVSVRFRSKKQGTRVKTTRKMAQVKERGGGGEERKVWLLPLPHPPISFFGSRFVSPAVKTENPVSLGFFCSETKRRRLLRRLRFKQS